MWNSEWGLGNYGSNSEHIPHSTFPILNLFSVHARLAQQFAQCGHADFAELAGRDLPDLRVEQLDGDTTGITHLPEVVEDRRQLEVAVARQNAIAVGRQLARHAR